MRVLVVGGGGREHALCWKLAQSPLLTALFCAPGNPGTASVAENVAIAADDVPALVRFATDREIDLVVPGPEAALVAGLADSLGLAGLRCCGPSAAAARIESSKSFCKILCDRAGISTADWARCDTAAAARAEIRRRGTPLVVKADGLAAGKGVVVATSVAEAEAAVTAFMETGTLGTAGRSVVIEEMLVGHEASVFALCDGRHAIPFGSAKDHKRLDEGDTGPNTGGMGAVSPAPGLTPAREARIMERIIRPALAELARQGTPYRGILFAGLMLTGGGETLIEFNARFGDPETQAILPRMRSDLLPALLAACDGDLDAFSVRFAPEVAVSVVLAAHGYPGEPARGGIIGLPAPMPDVELFHAATALRSGRLEAAGGRVLTAVATGADAMTARTRAIAAADAVVWQDKIFRRDIRA